MAILGALTVAAMVLPAASVNAPGFTDTLPAVVLLAVGVNVVV